VTLIGRGLVVYHNFLKPSSKSQGLELSDQYQGPTCEDRQTTNRRPSRRCGRRTRTARQRSTG
jgi:hypothetical protein